MHDRHEPAVCDAQTRAVPRQGYAYEQEDPYQGQQATTQSVGALEEQLRRFQDVKYQLDCQINVLEDIGRHICLNVQRADTEDKQRKDAVETDAEPDLLSRFACTANDLERLVEINHQLLRQVEQLI